MGRLYLIRAGIIKKRMYGFGLPELEDGKNVRIIDIAEDQELGPRKISVEKERVWIMDDYFIEQTIEAIRNGEYHRAVWGTFFPENYLGVKILTDDDIDAISDISEDYVKIKLDSRELYSETSLLFPKQRL